MTNLISQKNSNYQYAPGIPLYGVDGKDGKSGESGTSIFVSQFRMDELSDLQKFGSYIRQGRSTSLGSAEYIGRSYINGDAFIFPNGYIYKLKDIAKLISTGDSINEDYFKECFDYVGRITVDNEESGFVDSNDRLVLDTTNYKGFVINVSELPDSELSSIESPMTIISDKIDNDENIKFLDLKSIQSGQADVQFKIQYDTNNRCYMIESDNPILINADLEVAYSDTNSTVTYDEYSKVLTQENDTNTITALKSLCSELRYTEGDTKVFYEFDVDKASEEKTYQIYYINHKEDNDDYPADWWGPTDLKKFETPSTEPTSDNDYRMWKFKLYYDKDSEHTNLKYKKIRFYACYNKDVDNLENSNWKVSCQFRRYTSDGNTVGWNQMYNLLEKNGEDITIIDNRTVGFLSDVQYGTSGAFMYVSKNQIYVPSDVDEFWISAPKCFYILTYGNYDELQTIGDNKILEEEQVNVLVNEEGPWGRVRFPIDVLRFTTIKYETNFNIRNTINRQTVYKLPETGIIHFVGLMPVEMEDGYPAWEVDREYYCGIESQLIEPGGEQTIKLVSYESPSSIEWKLSFIGETEFVLTN